MSPARIAANLATLLLPALLASNLGCGNPEPTPGIPDPNVVPVPNVVAPDEKAETPAPPATPGDVVEPEPPAEPAVEPAQPKADTEPEPELELSAPALDNPVAPPDNPK